MNGWNDAWSQPLRPQSVTGPDGYAPCVLLADAREGGEGILLHRAHDIIDVHSPDAVADAFVRVRQALRNGLHVAGFNGYEAAAVFRPKLVHDNSTSERSILWLGCFEEAEQLNSVRSLLPLETSLDIGPNRAWSRSRYIQALERVLEYIEAGNLYQANITFQVDVSFSNLPLSHYAAFRRSQRAGWEGIVNTGHGLVVSCSPELFFSAQNGELVARPMKGTHLRGRNACEDVLNRQALERSEEDRAENLMIVDLVHNDLSQVARGQC